MKTCFTFLILFFAYGVAGAQISDSTHCSGIYMSWQDYQAGKLSYVADCNSLGNKIQLHHIFSGEYVDVIVGNKKNTFSKDSIFGYRDCEKKEYRFFKSYDKEYRIMENKTVVLYMTNIPVPSSTGKTVQLVPGYFFSKDLHSDILPLTILNLKRAFPDNLKFHDMLDVQLNSEKDISAFDTIHKMYKINYLLTQSILTKSN